MTLHEKFASILPEWRDRVGNLLSQHKDVLVDEVTIGQIYGGMRGVKCLVTDVSYVDPNEGIRLREYTIPELMKQLPKPQGSQFPLAGGVLYLLMIGEIPTFEQAMEIEKEWIKRAELPDHLVRIIRSISHDTHPMAMFSQAVLALQKESVFAKEYSEGLDKMNLWQPMLEDVINLTAKLTSIAAFIYNLKYGDGELIKPNPELDWSANFTHMIGKGDDEDFKDLMRLYFFLHCDHESGNVCAHTTHLVGSTMSDIYYAASAGLNGLAGPLHGKANGNCLRWLLDVRASVGVNPSKEELEAFVWDTLNSGQVIPGHGHAVLRIPDPRFTAQLDFGRKYMQDDEFFKLAEMVFEVVPSVLGSLGKVKNPWPNVDAISGTLLHHFGITQFDFYTVLFGVSRILGVSTNLVWARAIGQPIERPKCLTTKMMEDIAKG